MVVHIEELVIDNVGWQPYSPSDDANIIGCLNKDLTSDLKFRTISGDPTTEVLIPAGQEKSWGDYAATTGTSVRFPKNVVMGYFQSVSGTGPVKLEYGR